jgi:hypothetical protein
MRNNGSLWWINPELNANLTVTQVISQNFCESENHSTVFFLFLGNLRSTYDAAEHINRATTNNHNSYRNSSNHHENSGNIGTDNSSITHNVATSFNSATSNSS